MKLRSLALAAAVAVAGVCATAEQARAVVIERVVAVVGDQPILLTELRHRARPNLIALATSREGHDLNFQAAAQSEVFKRLLNQMIDDRLMDQAAAKAHLSVQPEDIDRGIANVANNAHMSVQQVLDEVRHEGLSEVDYRDIIQRRILQGKLIELRVRPRVRVTEQDARAAYQHWRQDEQMIEIRVMALQVPPSAGEEVVQRRMKLADEVARRARSGEDFCALIEQFTDDPTTRGTCGSHGPQQRKLLYPQLQQALTGMKANDVSTPIRIQFENIDAIIVFQLASEPKFPAFEEVKAQMAEQAGAEALDKQIRLWLDELRRGVYIDVRL